MLLRSTDATEAAPGAQAFGRSVSKIRESNPNEGAPPELEENDGLPLLGLPTEKRHVTDNLQAHAPPVAPEGKK